MKRLLVVALLLAAGCSNNPYRQAQPPQQQVGESLPSGDPKPGDAKTRAKAHTDLGMLYYQNAQMATALDEARVALAADANCAPAYNLLGLVHMYLNEHAEADAAFQRSIGLAPNDPETNNNYGWYLCTRGREQDGIRLLMVAVTNPLYQTPTRPYTNAGLCALRLNDLAADEDYFRKAVQADRSNVQALYQLANVNYQRGNYFEIRKRCTPMWSKPSPPPNPRQGRFKVMGYTSDDRIIAKQLEDIGCVAVMPLASLIGSGMGILNPWNLQIIIDNAKVPVVVDAGVGTASDAAIAMELGCDAVLMNTGVAAAKNPVLMATAMCKAVEAGRAAFLAGRMPKKLYSASPSSPTAGLIGKP